MNSVSGLCLCLRDTALKLTCHLNHEMASRGRGRGRRGRPRGTGQTPPVFDQQAFVEAVGIAVAAIAHAGIAGSPGGPSKLQRFRTHHSPTIGSCRSRRCYRLWRLPLTLLGLG